MDIILFSYLCLVEKCCIFWSDVSRSQSEQLLREITHSRGKVLLRPLELLVMFIFHGIVFVELCFLVQNLSCAKIVFKLDDAYLHICGSEL